MRNDSRRPPFLFVSAVWLVVSSPSTFWHVEQTLSSFSVFSTIGFPQQSIFPQLSIEMKKPGGGGWATVKNLLQPALLLERVEHEAAKVPEEVYDRRDPNRATTKKVCLRIVPVMVHDDMPGQTLETMDNGSDVSLSDSELAKELSLQGEKHDFLLTTQEKKDSPKSGLELKLTVSSLDDTSTLEMPRLWTVNCLNMLSRSIPTAQDIQGWPYLSDIVLPEIQSKDVTVLIGCNAPEPFGVMEERRGARGEPVAVRLLLGWTLMGPTEKIEKDSSVNFVRLEDDRDCRDEALLHQVEKFWKMDFVDALCSSEVAMSVEDQKAKKIIKDSVVKVSGHYQVALPWRYQPPYLPTYRIAAEQRLKLSRKRFLRDEEFFQRYKGAINEYTTKGYARQVPDKQLNPTDKPLWYLPHHAVFHPHKPDKLRVVFHCAAKF